MEAIQSRVYAVKEAIVYVLSNVYHYRKHLHGSHLAPECIVYVMIPTKQCVSLQEEFEWKPFNPSM